MTTPYSKNESDSDKAVSDKWKKGFNEPEGMGKLWANIVMDAFARTTKGFRKYGPDFQGDPLQQAYEEALDLVWYLKVELLRTETDSASKRTN